MRAEGATQFSIAIETKNRLDRVKAQNKELILDKYQLKKRMVTNTKVIDFLLDVVEEKELLKKDKRKK